MNTPVLCASYNGFDIYFEGYGWELPRTDQMMDGLEESRYADICGEDIDAISDEGWQFIDEPVCFTAANKSGRVVAIAWAAPMRTEDKSIGCNLTYAVDAQYEGRGLAKLLTALAFLAADPLHPKMQFTNVESRTDNLGSIALVESFGFARYPDGDFTMPISGGTKDVEFYGFRMNIDEFRLAAHRTLEQKNMHELLGLIKTSASARQSKK